jgi:hypothetical protein
MDSKEDVLSEINRLFKMCTHQFSSFEKHIQKLNNSKEQMKNEIDSLRKIQE